MMKLTAIFLCMACMHVAAKGLSQGITLQVKDAPLEKVFLSIQQQSGYSFVYNNVLIKGARKVTISIANTTLSDALEQCFKNQTLSYTIIKNTIVVTQKADRIQTESVPVLFVLDIKGTVLNELEEPIVGATITINGRDKSTITNQKGEFFIRDVSKGDILLVTSVSYKPVELKLTEKQYWEIRMEKLVVENDDVVLKSGYSTGYQVVARERATGSFYRVGEDVINRTVSSDIISRLSNVTSGFQVYRNQLSVRGRSTLFANQEPLIIVDNFPYDGRIENLNPNDIETITVLKDAAAASIWGALSGNGVIVITTKTGKYKQPLKINLVASTTIGNKPDLFYNPAFLNSNDFIDVEAFLFDKGYYNAALGNTTTFPAVSPVVGILAARRAGNISNEEANAQINALRGLDVRNELSRYFYRKSQVQQYALNVSGGSEKSSYFMSVGFDNNTAHQVANNNSRFTVNTNISVRPVKRLEITGGVNIVQSKGNNNNIAGSIGATGKSSLYPYARLADANGVPLPLIQGLSAAYIQPAESKGLLNWDYYPLHELDLQENTTKRYDTRLNGSVKYTIMKGLSVEGRYQYLKSISNNETLYSEDSYFVRNQVNRFTVLLPGGVVKRNFPYGDIYNTNNNDLASHGGRGQVVYDNRIGKHRISTIGGIEIRQITTSGIKNGFYGYDNNTGTYSIVNFDTLYRTLPNGSGRIPNNGDISGTLNRFRSYFGNMAYTYNDRYTVSASGRIDQSNFFGYKTNQRSVPLWSAGVKWNINKESFYNVSYLPELSLRATYGFNGNLDKSASPLTLAQYARNDVLTGARYGTISSPGNPELTWEKIGMLNIGIDFATINNRFTGSIEYYTKKGRNMIGDAPLDPTTGFSAVTGNFSNMKAKGVDVVLNTVNINKVINWSTTFLFNFTSNKVTNYTGTNASTRILEGRPVASLFVYRWAGLDAETGDPLGYLADTISNNYAAITALELKDRLYIGSLVPVFFGSILNTFTYKGFSLSVNLSYSAGHYFTRQSINYSSLFSNWIGHEDFSTRWQQKGDERKTSIPSMTYPANTRRDQFYSQSEVLVAKGNQIRIEDIRMNFSLNKRNWKKNPFEYIQLFTLVSNVGLLWNANKKGVDPNFVNAGFLPPLSLSIGFNAQL